MILASAFANGDVQYLPCCTHTHPTPPQNLNTVCEESESHNIHVNPHMQIHTSLHICVYRCLHTHVIAIHLAWLASCLTLKSGLSKLDDSVSHSCCDGDICLCVLRPACPDNICLMCKCILQISLPVKTRATSIPAASSREAEEEAKEAVKQKQVKQQTLLTCFFLHSSPTSWTKFDVML